MKLLKVKQKMLAELMVNNPNMTNEEYAKEIGISPNTLYIWKNKEEFQDYLHELCQKKFRSLERLAMSKLKDQVMNDKWQAIQYLLDGNGYKATEQQQVQMDARLEIDYGD